ncbi:UDP-N-acetylmuramoylalanyl-D-glutamyl-2, 6-diaminopimelate--D-alanyl-D-alanine ligase [Candidatus Liberibacter solanacearum]|uniref:UDP-N-acetylmuramoyl-tripeptide--D-alanyl-D-alanine ligase n=1 Tax=Candidatus Liberibacter solanacearum TaxID=556287 RepID=A0A095BG67_9HYPH|nr:UDP-N-acetylmuramoyl-tripeptide--D-alanyl-D-alanine ligase [Candidatus Liberibacter solanacearum]KGB27763.1 UDP-N-acetylmuramoylalanyl-D-glutamyl-2, 6-diaminopimelate--D-alanyl-D-alanine ligase [Candidatus Liberibacter solanacearum]KJZ81458.1 UDP-N-acetylmuramoylalanyl-D-glutamyl-2, 6-diaminopimelate--D-alanyl-D-alanine ligase [Candidatus Liberibacter solanacearum]KJZ82594.1 UDP-N-acetylmuramoylalanyl-D-glutamyl-2,6- diaminopimelate--D-alanyl-D-alanine ligase [Candidatus Liberibacter solanace
MSNLWAFHDLLHAIQGKSLGEVPEDFVQGISIDSRSIAPKEAFFAIKGDHYDGHDFVLHAVQKNACLVIINAEMMASIGPLSVPVFVVEDVLSALNKLASAARLRSQAKIIAITGSVGKTTAKEMLKLALSSAGKIHVSIASYNNHIGVPLTLAQMPADAEFGIFELGMSHLGEIRFLTHLVRPHIAMITTIAPAHLGNFSGIEEIASAKSEIFEGLEKTGTVLLNRDDSFFEFLKEKSHSLGIYNVYTFGEAIDADFRLLTLEQCSEESRMRVQLQGKSAEVVHHAVGRHMAQNILATLGIVSLLDASIEKAIQDISLFYPQKGRGKRYRCALKEGFFTMIDESYNANPTSMRAAISVLSQISPHGKGRRIAVLGDMSEMGERAESFHIDLAEILSSYNISHVWLSGFHVLALKNALPKDMHVHYREKIDDFLLFIQSSLIDGDVIVIKSSHSCGFHSLVELLLEEFTLIQ